MESQYFQGKPIEKVRRQLNLRAFDLRSLHINLRTTLEFESHPPIGVNGYCIYDNQPELFIKLGEGIQFLHLEHKGSDGFCLGFPCSLCGAELLKLSLCLFVPLHKPIVPGGVFFLVLCRLRILRNTTLCQFGHHINLLKQALDFCVNARAVC